MSNNLPTTHLKLICRCHSQSSQILSHHSILCSLHWLKITKHIKYKLLSFTYKVRTTTKSYQHVAPMTGIAYNWVLDHLTSTFWQLRKCAGICNRIISLLEDDILSLEQNHWHDAAVNRSARNHIDFYIWYLRKNETFALGVDGILKLLGLCG